MTLNFDFREYSKDIANRFHAIQESFNDDNTVSDEIDEATETYNKIQKILNCPEMEKCHPYLFSLDMENVDESDTKKINELYECGVKRGVIKEDKKVAETEKVDECDDFEDDRICGGVSDDALTSQEMKPLAQEPSVTPSAFTVLYSAMKDGQIKTGEYYSNAIDNPGAKEDCIANLTQVGYSNIKVLGIEQTNSAVDTNIDTSAVVDMSDTSTDASTADLYETDAEDEAQETGDTEAVEKKEDKTDDNTEDNTEEKTKDKTDEVKDEVKTDDNEKKDDAKEKEDQSEEDNQEDVEKDTEDEKKLTAEEKTALKQEYTDLFKSILHKMKLEKSVNDMTLKEKGDFYKELVSKWSKEDPGEFLTDKEQDKLNKTIVKQ